MTLIFATAKRMAMSNAKALAIAPESGFVNPQLTTAHRQPVSALYYSQTLMFEPS